MRSGLRARLAQRYEHPQHPAALNPAWPILTSYADRALDRIALPLGGIGTGTISLGGRGDLRDWEIMNRPAKGHVPRPAFFAMRARAEGQAPVARCLEGPILTPFEGAHGAPNPNAGLPRFERATFHAAYPFGQMVIGDSDLPTVARLEAFNPLIPPDVDRSSMPFTMLRYVITNHGDSPLEISVAGTVQNIVGNDGVASLAAGNVNTIRSGDGLTGVLMSSEGVPTRAEQWGTIALAALATNGQDCAASRDWAHASWSGGRLAFWDDLLEDGLVDDHESKEQDLPVATINSKQWVQPGDSGTFTFLVGWHFPNRMSWEHGLEPLLRVGNHYATRYTDAWDVLVQAAAELDELERDTIDFVSTLLASPLPDVVKEAALYNTSTLRTQTCFRIGDGAFFGWEGCNDTSGSCYGNCTHVWNYEQASPFLFAPLARSMREVEFLHATTDAGRMSFRSNLPLERADAYPVAAADGQMGCIMKLHREWRMSGDDAWLARLWPHARSALEFAWIPGGWDADEDGVMEGCQHNTMDCEYYGPNPQMGFWYLGALRAAEEMARHIGEDEFAGRCRSLFESGSRWLDAHLFNGDYYEHHIRPPQPGERVANGLRLLGDDDSPPSDPPLQIGAGCLIDQLVGQYMANITGLGPLGDQDNMRTALRTIKRHGFKQSLRDHFNNMRTYALGQESATLMCTYPRGARPARPFPYFAEVMTGFEYTLAVHFLQEGMVGEGLELIRAVRDRYDGERRNPFNEAECGHHYARAMASWGAVLALTGFDYDARAATMRMAHLTPGESMFWSNGSAWGTVTITRNQHERDILTARIAVHQGALWIGTLVTDGRSMSVTDGPRIVTAGQDILAQA